MRSSYFQLPSFWRFQPFGVFMMVHLRLVYALVGLGYSDPSLRVDAAPRYIRILLADDGSRVVLCDTVVRCCVAVRVAWRVTDGVATDLIHRYFWDDGRDMYTFNMPTYILL